MALLLFKSIIKHYYKKRKKKPFQAKKQKTKKIHEKLVRSQRAKKLGYFEIKLDNI